MSKVIAAITVSLDGYVTGPDDDPGQGLGVGGERLHYWVMGGPWTYETDHEPGVGMSEPDEAYYDGAARGDRRGRSCGRGMYDSAGAWGGTNPFGGTLVVLTHRIGDQPDESTGFVIRRRLRRGARAGRVRRPAAGASRSAAAPTSSGRGWRPVSSTSSASPPRRWCSVAASGSSRGSPTTSTSRSSRSTTSTYAVHTRYAVRR